MDLNETRKAIEGFLNSTEKHDYFGNEVVGQIEHCYDFVNKQINELIEDKEPENTEFRAIKLALSSIKKVTLYSPLSPGFIAFITNFSELIRNWNDNFKRDEEIQTELITIMRIIKQHFSIMEATEILKGLCNKLKDFQNWLPPAFNISSHYIDLLKTDGIDEPSECKDE